MSYGCTKCGACCTEINLKNYNTDYWGITINDNGNCTNLTPEKTCGIYEDRPLICRIEELYDRREEVRDSDPGLYTFLSNFKSKEEYIKHEEKSCNYMIDYLGLDKKYKIIEQVRFS